MRGPARAFGRLPSQVESEIRRRARDAHVEEAQEQGGDAFGKAIDADEEDCLELQALDLLDVENAHPSHFAAAKNRLVRSSAIPPADPFPIDALGDVLGAAAKGINDRVQAPMAMCGQSILGAATLAAQGHADVELPSDGDRPNPC